MGQLDGKTAVVTGGTTGIGLAAARRLASEGAHVFITGRRKPELDAAVESIGAHVTGVQGDVSVPNAGVGELATLEQVTEQHFDQTFDINVKGVLFTVQKALPLLSDGASIILPGSTAATSGDVAFGVYAASKAAVRSFARTWANELKARGIRVNAIAPGPTDTPGISGAAPDDQQAAQVKQAMAGQVPLGRMGRPEEIADAVLFLASDQSSFITGSNLYVDGGLNQI